MLEIIRAHAVNGFEYFYFNTIGGTPWVNNFIHLCGLKSYDTASTHASQKPVWEAGIKTVMEGYQ